MIEGVLEELGPSLSTDVAAHLVRRFKLSPSAARKRVSRSSGTVKRLAHLPFARKARFLYLEKQYASPWYWDSLFHAITSSGGPYARALAAVIARDVVPIHHFLGASGSPTAQKKQLSADTVLKRMILADIFVRCELEGLGECVTTKQWLEKHESKLEKAMVRIRARHTAEIIVLESVKEWLRRLAFVSYDSVRIRTINPTDDLPKVGTFTWDLSAPSYLAGLRDHQSARPKPGWVVCDILLDRYITSEDIQPFLNKVQTLQIFKNIGRALFLFVAQHYEPQAFEMLRAAGIIPATPESLFGKDVGGAFRELIDTLSKAAVGSLDPAKVGDLLTRLGKLEGALGNMRGAFFELLVAEVVRKTFAGQVRINKICNSSIGVAEVDVYAFNEGVDARLIECKGVSADSLIDDNEIFRWIETRIPRLREYLRNFPDSRISKPKFELWTSGLLSETAQKKIERTRAANARKFELVIMGPEQIRSIVTLTNDVALLQTFEQHFIPKKL